jgi:hypothetical protein
MALVKTTASAAISASDSVVNLTSATSVTAGRLLLIDNEFMKVQASYVSGTAVPVLRGINGSVQLAHVSGATAVHGDAADFANPPAQSAAAVNAPLNRVRVKTSYAAAGAIALPSAGTDAIAEIIGTGALAMTLANPAVDNDGDLLIIIANGKAAHTVTITSGIGNGGASFDVGTFSASLQTGCMLMAMNGYWVLVGNGIAGATAATAGPLWA